MIQNRVVQLRLNNAIFLWFFRDLRGSSLEGESIVTLGGTSLLWVARP